MPATSSSDAWGTNAKLGQLMEQVYKKRKQEHR